LSSTTPTVARNSVRHAPSSGPRCAASPRAHRCRPLPGDHRHRSRSGHRGPDGGILQGLAGPRAQE
jgi:hypothetical protein